MHPICSVPDFSFWTNVFHKPKWWIDCVMVDRHSQVLMPIWHQIAMYWKVLLCKQHWTLNSYFKLEYLQLYQWLWTWSLRKAYWGCVIFPCSFQTFFFATNSDGESLMCTAFPVWQTKDLFTFIFFWVSEKLRDRWVQAVISFCAMQLQLASVFFTFSLGTRTHYFGRTILHGGAKVTSVFLLRILLHLESLILLNAECGVTVTCCNLVRICICHRQLHQVFVCSVLSSMG